MKKNKKRQAQNKLKKLITVYPLKHNNTTTKDRENDMTNMNEIRKTTHQQLTLTVINCSSSILLETRNQRSTIVSRIRKSTSSTANSTTCSSTTTTANATTQATSTTWSTTNSTKPSNATCTT